MTRQENHHHEEDKGLKSSIIDWTCYTWIYDPPTEVGVSGWVVPRHEPWRRRVFASDEQREYFLGLLAATPERFNAEWHANCLMGNHYHLLVRTPEGNLQRIMRHVNGLYTQYFNPEEGRDGALFRGATRRSWPMPTPIGWR
jgi:hypothetical protein